MNRIADLSEAQQRRINEIAKELADHGLGIFLPHVHDCNGEIAPLPSDMKIYEDKLQVHFLPKSDIPVDSVEVGWMWRNGKFEACAHCCHH